MKLSTYIKIALSTIISLLASYIIYININLIEIKAITSVPFKAIFAAMIAYLLIIIFRAMRFKVLLRKNIPFRTMLNISFLHSMLNQLIPLKIGEISYIYLTKKFTKINLGEGASSLILARYFDLLAIAIIFILSSIFIPNLPPKILALRTLVMLLIIGLLAILASIFMLNKKIIKIYQQFSMITHINRSNINKKIETSLTSIIELIEKLKSKSSIIISLTYSLLIWISTYICFYILLQGPSFQLTIFQFSIVLSFLVIVNILPVNSFLSVGTFEGMLILGFTLFGVPLQKAVSYSILVHFFQIIFSVATGIIGYMSLTFSKKTYETNPHHTAATESIAVQDPIELNEKEDLEEVEEGIEELNEEKESSDKK